MMLRSFEPEADTVDDDSSEKFPLSLTLSLLEILVIEPFDHRRWPSLSKLKHMLITDENVC